MSIIAKWRLSSPSICDNKLFGKNEIPAESQPSGKLLEIESRTTQLCPWSLVFLFISEFDDYQARNSDDSMPSRGFPAAAISDHYPEPRPKNLQNVESTA